MTNSRQVLGSNQDFLEIDETQSTKFLRKLAWFFVAIGALLIIPVGFCKSIYLLLKLYPLEALKTFFSTLIAGFSLFLFALVNIFRPSLGTNFISMIYLPAKNLHSEIYTNYSLNVKVRDIEIDTEDLVSTNDKYLIHCCANADIYQASTLRSFNERDCKNLARNIRSFNYPGATDNHHVASKQMINAGIAQIYQLVNQHQWTNQQIAENVQLYGPSIGGAVALQVATYFKIHYEVDIPVFVDRSFRSVSAVVAGMLNKFIRLPFWYGKWFAKLLLYAAGDFEMDSIAAFKKLNHQMVSYINLGHLKVDDKNKSWLEKCKGYWTDSYQHADSIICDGATFAEGVEEEMPASSVKPVQTNGMSTSWIYTGLNRRREDHLVFGSVQHHHHVANLERLHAADTNNTTAYAIYKTCIFDHDGSKQENDSRNIRPM